jgi:hypothetical protein
LVLAGGHNVINPVPWQKTPDGRMVKAENAGDPVKALKVVNINPLYTIYSLESAGATEGTYFIGVEREAAARPVDRRKKSALSTIEQKTESYILHKAAGGTPEHPLVNIELTDGSKPVEMSAEKPLKRISGFTADLSYPPEKKVWAGRRQLDEVVFAGDRFTVQAINSVANGEFEVILSARSTGKKTTIRFSGGM